jgi:hypothetical protein
MENTLSTWTEDQHQCCVPVGMLLVQAKACSIYEDLSKCDDNLMLNHLVQVQVGLAGSQKDIIFIT